MLEEIRSRSNLENACHHLVQNIVSCYLLSNNVKAKIHGSVFFVILYK